MLQASKNCLFVIVPYRWQGTWVFDDERVGLVREPFVSGVPEILDELVQGTPDAQRGFRLIFSASGFPGYSAKFRRVREEFGGHWYASQSGAEGWLCPALFKYFDAAPEEIYVRAEPREEGVTSSNG